MKSPKVSVLLPIYNGSRFMSKSIESVLLQSFEDFELIIIDDGSTDMTSDIAKEFMRKDKRVVFVSNKENLGIQKALNNGMRIAKGEYIARIDDDDEWISSDKLANQLDFLERNSNHVLVGTGVIVVDEQRNEIFRFLQPSDDEAIRKKMLFKSYFMHSTVLFRKDIALNLGGYGEGENTRHVEDYDLWLRLGTVGELANLPAYDIRFMLRKSAISAKYKSEQFRRNIGLVKTFRNNYPRFWGALLYSYSRLWAYKIYKHLPTNMAKHKILEVYKKL